MWTQHYRNRSGRVISAVLTLACLVTADAAARTRSQLSLWLSDTAQSEIQELATRHPRVINRSIHVVARGSSALDEAIASTLRDALGRRENLHVIMPRPEPHGWQQLSANVDELRCDPRPLWDQELQVSVVALDKSRTEVQLDLVDLEEPAVAFQTWRWRGKLSSAERGYFKQLAQPQGNNGSISAPWDEGEVEQAAVMLSEQLACDLRPNIVDQIKLVWPDTISQEAFAPTISDVRRRLGYFREITEAGDSFDYRLKVEWHPAGEGVWQLLLSGTPTRERLPGIQAATYVRALAVPAGQDRPANHVLAPLLAPRPGQPASEYLQVDMLDVSQSDRGLASADLRVRLRLVNRADRGLEYGLSLSGGHYVQCIPQPDYYRHDRYAYMEGQLAPGQSVVRVLEIVGAKHNPNPWFGTPRCAGFKELEGLEDFANQGHKVTQFIRWAL